VEGIVTMEDVVETLLGLEIVDEADSVEDMQALARRQWFKRAKQLGMVQEAVEESSSEQEAIIRLGITGGEFPGPVPPEESAEESSASREE
jgi:CBS domain containing-hemolysin-like protein